MCCYAFFQIQSGDTVQLEVTYNLYAYFFFLKKTASLRLAQLAFFVASKKFLSIYNLLQKTYAARSTAQRQLP